MFRREIFSPPPNVEPKPKLDSTAGMIFKIGVVKFFNADKGYGFIQRPDCPDLFFHAANYRDLVLDRSNYHLKLVLPEPERAMVQLKAITPAYVREIRAMLDGEVLEDPEDGPAVKTEPVLKERWVVRPSRTPKSNDIICYTEGKDKFNKSTAQYWFYANDYPLDEMRRELDTIHAAYVKQINNLPVYRFERRELVYSEPKANNAKKCFESEVLKDSTSVIFLGNSVEALKYYADPYLRFDCGANITYQCYKSTQSGEFVPCDLPN